MSQIGSNLGFKAGYYSLQHPAYRGKKKEKVQMPQDMVIVGNQLLAERIIDGTGIKPANLTIRQSVNKDVRIEEPKNEDEKFTLERYLKNQGINFTYQKDKPENYRVETFGPGSINLNSKSKLS